MKLNVEYRLNPLLTDLWDNASCGNSQMRAQINKHGGSFTPVAETVVEGERFITKVIFADAEIGSCEDFGEDYFEIAESEFKFFVEVTEEITGVNRLDVTITPDNVDEMIELIKKVFKK